MCHFITMILPAGTGLEASSGVFARHNRKPVCLVSRHVDPFLQTGEVYLFPSRRMCDCGTALGSLNRQPESERISKATGDRFRKQGWSDAKIQRWLEQRSQTDERDRRISDAKSISVAGRGPDGWHGILRGLVCDLRLTYAGILLHWYSGGLETEKIEVKRRVTLPMDDKLTDALYRVEEDTFYIIKHIPPTRGCYLRPSFTEK